MLRTTEWNRNELLAAVPVKPDLGILGHRWAVVILTDIGLRKIDRFTQILRAHPGLSPRMLSLRLRELERNSMIERAGTRNPPKPVRWTITEKGQDLLPALVRLIVFGARWNADNPFKNRVPNRIGTSDC